MRPGPLFLGWPWRLRLALIRGQDLEGGEGAALCRAAVRSEPGIKRPVPRPGRPRWRTRAHSDPDDSEAGRAKDSEFLGPSGVHGRRPAALPRGPGPCF